MTAHDKREGATRYKLEEAAFFLDLATRHFNFAKKFDFYLSAFVNAARAVTWMMKAEYGKVPGFKEWYDAEQAKADERLKEGTATARNRSLKARPLRTLARLHVLCESDDEETWGIVDRIIKSGVPWNLRNDELEASRLFSSKGW